MFTGILIYFDILKYDGGELSAYMCACEFICGTSNVQATCCLSMPDVIWSTGICISLQTTTIRL